MAWWSKALDIVSAPLSQPSTFFKEGWGAAAAKVKKTREEIERGEASGLKVIGTTLATTAILGGAVVGGAAVIAAPKVAAAAAAKFIIPATLKGKIIGGTAALIGTGILVRSPKARTFVAETAIGIPEKVGGILEFGEEVGGVIEGESVFTKEKIVTGLKVAGVVGAGVAAAAIIVPKVKTWWEERGEKAPPTLSTDEEQLIPEKAVGQLETPVLPATTTITTGKKPYKRRRATITPSVKQSVRVNVISSPRATGMKLTSKRYINQPILA